MPSYRAAVRVLFKDDECQTEAFRTCTMVGTCNHYGLSIVNPAKGAAKRWRVIKRSPRAGWSQLRPRGLQVHHKRFPRVGIIPVDAPRKNGRGPRFLTRVRVHNRVYIISGLPSACGVIFGRQ